LEEYQNSEQLWTDVKNLIDLSVDQMNDGIPAVNTAVGKLLREDNKLNNPNPFETEQWKTSLNEALTAVKFYQDTTEGLIDTNAGDIDNLEGAVAGLESEIDQLKSTEISEPKSTEVETNVVIGAMGGGSSLAAQGPNIRLQHVAVTAYKTGGLADFTGPAWLDGTKARPEMVLN
jgi:hypothetical protein